MYLISGQAAAGTATASKAAYNSDLGLLFWEFSGNNATASLLCSPDVADGKWLSVTSVAATAGTTGMAQISGLLPFVAARVDWVSGGNAAVKVYLQYVSRQMGM